MPTIKNVMRNLTLNPGERALFRCKVDMKCMVSYIQWYHEMTNGQLLLSFEKSEITWKMCSFKYGEKNTTILSPRISCYRVTLLRMIFFISQSLISISTAGSVRLLRTGATAGTPYSYMINKVRYMAIFTNI